MRNFRLRFLVWRWPSLQEIAIVGSVGLCLAFIGILLFLKFGGKASANWYNDSWLYRTAINFGNTGSSDTYKKVKVEIDTASLITAGKMKTDCSDSRFTDINGNPLSFYQGYNLGSADNLRHESNDFSEYTSTSTDTGDLTTSAAAALGASSYGLSMLIDDTNNIYGTKNITFSGNSFRFRYYIDPNTLTMASGDAFYNTGFYDGGTAYVYSDLSFSAGNYAIRAFIRNDAGSTSQTSTYTITDAPHYVEIEVNKATTNAANDATLELYVDGVLKETLSGIDFYDQYALIDSTRWGVTASLDAGTSGTFYMDEIAISDNSSTIGPVADGCNNASTDYYVLIPSILSGSNSIFHYYGNQNPPANTVTMQFNQDTFSPTSGPTLATEEQSPGPAVIWNFDEGSGTTAYDSTANGTNGVLTSGPIWKNESECISGKCLFFDGSNDHVIVSAPDSVKSTTRTVSYWIKPLNFNATQGVVTLGGTNYYAGITTSGRIIESHQNSSNAQVTTTSPNNSLTLNEWQHVALVTVTSGTAVSTSYYVNGIFIETDTLTSGHGTAYGTSLRAARITSASANLFAGYLDEIKIYPYARTANQIKQDFLSRGSINGIVAQFANPDLGAKLSQGLITYFKFDETSSPSRDSIGVGTTGTWSGNVAATTGKFANAAILDGSGDYITSGTSSAINPGTGDISISAWIKPTTLTGDQTGIIKYENGNTYYILEHMDNDTLRVEFRDGTCTAQVFTTTDTLSTGAWTHVAATFDRDKEGVIYINGKKSIASSVITSCQSSMTGGILTIGRHVADFDGIIDEGRIYNRALDATEIRTLYNFAPSPFAYWKFDDNTGTSANDSSGNNNTATLTSGPLWTIGKMGNAVYFDGTNDYVDTSTNNSLKGMGQFTISTWINPNILNSTEQNIYVEPRGSDGSVRVQLAIASDNRLYFGIRAPDSGGVTTLVDDTRTLTANTWYHVEAVFDSVTDMHTLYLNGVGVTSNVASVGLDNTAPNSAPRIGSQIGSGYFNGAIDDVKIYDYARTSFQIIEDMNGGHPVGGSPIGSQSGYWKFDEGYGSTANDSSSYSNNMTLGTGASAPSWSSSGKYHKALNFDGTDDFVSITDPSNGSLDMGLEGFTISSWINTSDTSLTKTVIDKKNGTSATAGYNYRITTTGRVQANIANGTANQTCNSSVSNRLDTGAWRHIIFTLERGAANDIAYIYIDGQLDTQCSFTAGYDVSGSTNFFIGKQSNNTNYFKGLVDEVKVYRTTMTSNQVATEYNRGKAIAFGSTSTASDGITSDNSSAREYCLPGDTTSCSSPVGEWKMDENTGTSAEDTSGNNLTITLANNVPWTQGRYGSALSFLNNNHDATATSNSLLHITGNISVSLWINSSTIEDADVIATVRGGGETEADNEIFLLEWDTTSGNDILYQHENGAGVNNNNVFDTNLSANTWYFITLTRNVTTNEVKLYVDGIQAGSTYTYTNDPTCVSCAANLRVGLTSTSSTSNRFQGYIDNLLIYNYVRTSAQIAWDYNRGAPLVHYKLDDCQGTTSYNSALNGNAAALGMNGTITASSNGNTAVGTCTSATSTHMWSNGATGKINSSLHFDGSDDFVSAAYDSRLSFRANQDFTVAAWVKSSQVAQLNLWPHVVSRDDNNATRTGFNLATANSNSTPEWYFQIYVANTLYSNTGRSNIRDGTWHHLVGMRKGATLETYEDGIFVRSVAASTGALDRSIPLRLGGNSAGASPDYWSVFGGSIDDVRIYNYALTPVLVKTLYNNGAVSFK